MPIKGYYQPGADKLWRFPFILTQHIVVVTINGLELQSIMKILEVAKPRNTQVLAINEARLFTRNLKNQSKEPSRLLNLLSKLFD